MTTRRGTLFLCLLLPLVSSLRSKCSDGQRRSTENNDKDSILHESNAWGRLEGFWKVQQYLMAPGGEPLPPFPVDPKLPVNPIQLPYSSNPVAGFVNVTIQGSRLYQHVYHIYGSAPDDFCNEPVPEKRANALGGGTCGEDGFLWTEDFFGTAAAAATSLFGGEGLVAVTRDGDSSYYFSRALDDQTVSLSRRNYATGLLKTETIVAISAHHLTSVAQYSGENAGFVALQRTEYERLSDAAAFIDAIRAAFKDFQIPEEDQVELPMTSDCLGTFLCPTTADWCALDPTCNSALQMPSSSPSSNQSSTTGLAVGMTVLVALLVIGALYVFHVRAVQREAKRHRSKFARRIAYHLERMVSPYALDADQLYDEMCKVDPGLYDRPGALISKVAMKEFIQSGLAGYITEADFGALWAAIDDYNTGYVDFLEYCSLLAQCHKKYEASCDTRDREDLAKMICKHLSKLARQVVKAKTKSLGAGTIDRGTSSGSNYSSLEDDELMIVITDDVDMEISAMGDPEGMVVDGVDARSSHPSAQTSESIGHSAMDTPATYKSLGSASHVKSVKSLGSGVVFV